MLYVADDHWIGDGDCDDDVDGDIGEQLNLSKMAKATWYKNVFTGQNR